MGQQFPDVSCTYGAPMGRKEWHEVPTEAGALRLFRVRLNAGGYDDGGAYWGVPHGPDSLLYCATDGENFRRFVRAGSRLQAAAELGLAAWLYATPPNAAFARLRHLEANGRLSASGVILRQRLQRLGFGTPRAELLRFGPRTDYL